jgi:preprotein translocase subunit SecB
MTKKSDNITNEENIGDIPPAPLIIHKQYLKDMSFESPNSPGILVSVDQRPEMDMNILLDIQKIDNPEHDYFYEVILTLTTSAKREDKTLFLAEVIYGATASIQGLEEKQHHPLLFIEVPQLMFPFARQILANATQSGGFTPLQLSPVDFRSIYLRRFAQKQDQSQTEDKTEEVSKTA